MPNEDKNPFGAMGGFFAGAAKAAVDTASKVANEAGKAASGAVGAAADLADRVGSAASSAAEDAFMFFGGSSDKVYTSSFRNEDGSYVAPDPIVDNKEEAELNRLTFQYEELTKPNPIAALTQKAGNVVVAGASKAISVIGKDELYSQSMEIISGAFDTVRDQASKISASEGYVLSEINKSTEGSQVSSIEEVRLLRSYDLAKIARDQRKQHLTLALVEGAATGVPGLPGIPFNLVLSTFLFYRAVQSIAMFYGYDVKNDPSELELAGNVLMEAMSVGQASDSENEAESAASSQFTKLMMLGEIATVKQTVNKGWAEMAKKGGACLLVTQIRAMGNAGVKKTLESTGRKGLEAGVFKSVFEKIGKNLSRKVVARAVPVVGGVVGAAFDTAQMNTILKYADLFYHKRFIVEKEVRVNALVGGKNIDDYLEIEDGFEIPAE